MWCVLAKDRRYRCRWSACFCLHPLRLMLHLSVKIKCRWSRIENVTFVVDIDERNERVHMEIRKQAGEMECIIIIIIINARSAGQKLPLSPHAPATGTFLIMKSAMWLYFYFSLYFFLFFIFSLLRLEYYASRKKPFVQINWEFVFSCSVGFFLLLAAGRLNSTMNAIFFSNILLLFLWLPLNVLYYFFSMAWTQKHWQLLMHHTMFAKNQKNKWRDACRETT